MTAAAIPLLLALGTLLGGGPPYETRMLATCSTTNVTTVRGMVSVDLDGDGLNELVYGCRTGLLVLSRLDGTIRTPSQFNFSPEFVAPGAEITLGPAADLDGDGRPEIVATARDAAGAKHRLWALDLVAERYVLDLELPVGEDRRADGIWDGAYHVAGVLPGPAGPLLLVAMTTGFDKLPRTLSAYDPGSGEPVWSFAFAANPWRNVVADLDGDGRPEIVVGEAAGDNLGPEQVRGRSDDESWLVVLDGDGRLRWERKVGPLFTTPRSAVCDLDGDGAVEVVVTTESQHLEFVNQLTVFAGASGDTLAQVDLGPTCRFVHAWRDAATPAGAIVCVLDDGRILRFEYARGRLRQVARRRLPTAAHQVVAADMLPTDGPEFLVAGIGNQVSLLSADLKPLARLDDRLPRGPVFGTWNVGPEAILMYANAANSGQRLVPVPLHRRYAGPAAGGTLLLGAGLAGGTLVRQRRRLRNLRRSSRRDLLRAFLTARHGTVGPVGILERVLWAAEHREMGGAARLHEAWSAARAEAVPDLQALLDKAAHIRLDPPLLAIVRRELARLCGLCDELVRVAPETRSRDELLRDARTSLGLVADGVRSMGATLSAASRLDPLPVVREVVERYRQRAPRLAITLEAAADPLVPPCYADAQDLEFALDNLLDNAVQQLADAVAPAVTIAVAAGPRQVTVAVDDNGPGVPAAARERIFARGVSSKPDGGVGLWHSREALRYYGGDLTVGDAPAGGARFVVVLRAAGSRAGAASPGDG